MNQSELYHAIRRIAWGYLLIHVNLNFGTINILPNWWGYLLFVMAISVLGKEDESANLLKPLGVLLVGAEFVFWLNSSLLGRTMNTYLFAIIISAIGLYFHFQLLTNLADIAHKYDCKEQKKILSLRTAKTILATVHTILAAWNSDANSISMMILITSAIVAIWICMVMFSFSKSIMEEIQEEVMVDD